MSQRLLRARKTLADAGAPVRVPDPDELADRLAQVLAVVYLFFNEGYLASSGRQPARRDLAAQAIALTRTLHRLMPREPEVLGLLALLLLHESRAAARFDGWGRLIRLQGPGPFALEQRPRRRGDAAARPCDGDAPAGAVPGAGGDRRAARRGGRLRADRLAADPPALQPPGDDDPVAGGAAQPGGRHPLRGRPGRGASRDRAPARRSRGLPPLPRPPGRPAHRPRPRRRGGGRERPGAGARRQPGRTRPAHPRPHRAC